MQLSGNKLAGNDNVYSPPADVKGYPTKEFDVAANGLARRIRFRLSTLLLSICVLAITLASLATIVDRYAKQDHCVEMLRKDGSSVYEDRHVTVVTSDNIFGSQSYWLIGDSKEADSRADSIGSPILDRFKFRRFTVASLATNGTLSLAEIKQCMAGMPWLEYMFIPEGVLENNELIQLQNEYPKILFQNTDRNGRTPGLAWEQGLNRF